MRLVYLRPRRGCFIDMFHDHSCTWYWGSRTRVYACAAGDLPIVVAQLAVSLGVIVHTAT